MLDALRLAKDRRDGKAPATSIAPKAAPSATSPSEPPPADGSIPPPGGVVVQDCSVCSKKVAEGDICKHCGWSNSQRKRLSPEGKEPGVSTTLGRPVSLAMIIAALVVGAGAFTLVGPFAGPAGALAGLGLIIVIHGATTTLRTDKFKVPPASFKKEEQERVKKVRNKLFALGALAVLVGGGVGSLHFSGSTSMRLDSLGIAWETNIGRGATSEGRSVEISTFYGSHTVGVLAATTEGVEYGLMRVTLPYAKRESFNEELMDEVLKKCTAAALDSSVTLEELSPMTHQGAAGRGGKIGGTLHGKPAFGSIRIFQYGHEFLLVYVAAPSQKQADDDTAKKYFASLTTIERGAAKPKAD